LTANRKILNDINLLFESMEKPDKMMNTLNRIKTLPVAPNNMRTYFMSRIDQEIEAACSVFDKKLK